MTIFNVISLAGGLALFLYGMSIMGSGLEKLAGSRLEGILQRLTDSTWKSVLLGAAITALIQSSSGTTVIVVGLVNSGIMKLTQAIGIIMGANIGTTVTGQILRLADVTGGGFLLTLLKPVNLAPLAAFFGAMLFVFSKRAKQKNIGHILIGFGLLFTGMVSMTSAVDPLRDSPLFVKLFTSLQNPFLGILAGTLVTLIIQSSSASVGILQALSATGVVTWGSAIPIILGQNIGTCSTPLIASIGASKAAKRSAIVHLYFNIIGSGLFLAAIYGAKAIFGFSWWNDTMNMGNIANFHTLFNVIVTLLFIPFTGLLARLAERTIPNDAVDAVEMEMPILDERLFSSPAVAIQQAKSAVETMAQNAYLNYATSVPVLFSHDSEALRLIQKREGILDQLESSISNYLIKITDKNLTEAESAAVGELINFVVEFERIGDYSINIIERHEAIEEKKISFTPNAMRELNILDSAILEIIKLTRTAFSDNDMSAARQVEPLEETIDDMIDLLREKHITRLKNGECGIESGIIFLDILTNIERISDHCSNVAARLIGGASGGDHFDAHEFRRKMHNGLVPDFNELQAQYRKQYLSEL